MVLSSLHNAIGLIYQTLCANCRSTPDQLVELDARSRRYPSVDYIRHQEFYNYQRTKLRVSAEDLEYMNYPDDLVIVVANSEEAVVKWVQDPWDGRWISLPGASCPQAFPKSYTSNHQ